MEPEKPKPPSSADERLARDVRQEAALLRNILHSSLWLVALIPTMLLLLVDMPLISRVITGILCAVFWGLAIGGMFRMTGLSGRGHTSKGNPLLPGGFLVTGLVYDVTIGRIEIVVPPALLRAERLHEASDHECA